MSCEVASCSQLSLWQVSIMSGTINQDRSLAVNIMMLYMLLVHSAKRHRSCMCWLTRPDADNAYFRIINWRAMMSHNAQYSAQKINEEWCKTFHLMSQTV